MAREYSQRLRREAFPKQAAEKFSLMPGHILIVEDDESLAVLLQYNLEAEGYKVDLVARAEVADLALRNITPDLLLLDWMLPGFSGLEYCRRLRFGLRHDSCPSS